MLPVDTGVATPQAPQAPQAGIGIGGAQIFLQDPSKEIIAAAVRERNRKQAEAIRKQKELDKVHENIYDSAKELKVAGYIAHLPELQAHRDSIQQYVTGKIMADKNYDGNDPVLLKRISDYGTEVETNKKVDEWARMVLPLMNKTNENDYTPESRKEVSDFLNTKTIGEKEKWIQEKGLPSFEPTAKVMDWRKDNESAFKSLGTSEYSNETPIEGGMTQIKSGKAVPKTTIDNYVKLYVQAGMNSQDLKAAALIQETANELTDKDPAFKFSPQEKQQELIKNAAEAKLKAHGTPFLSNESKTELQGGGGGEKKYAKTEADVKKDVPISIIKGGNKTVDGKVEHTTEKVRDKADYALTLSTNYAGNISNAEGIIDTNTGGQLVSDDGTPFVGQLEVSGADIYSTKVKKDGKVFYEPYLYATAKLPDATEEGKTVTKNVKIPLSKIRGDKAIEQDARGVDEIQRLTDKLNEGAASATKEKPHTIEASKVDPSKFIKGGYYNIKGKTYEWNGTNLIEQ